LDKQEAMQRLRAAKSAHLQWRARAQALVAGVDVDEDKIPMLHTDCKFGKWYYGEGQDMASLSSFKAIEEPHEILHSVYMKLFQALHGEVEQTGWRKLFGKKADHKAEQLEKAQEHLDQLVDISKTLLASIEVLESELKSMNDEEVKAL
jgi:predicted metal-dependent phosphoesterase TrpH